MVAANGLDQGFLPALRQEAQREGPGGIASFEQLQLNRWTQPVTAWGVGVKWGRLQHDGVRWKGLASHLCWGGLDLGAVDDVTGFVLAVPGWPHEDRVALLSMAWVADANAARIGPPAKVRDLQDRGWLRVTPGSSTDFRTVANDIADLVAPARMQMIGIDRQFEGHGMAQRLAERGLRVAMLSPRASAMSPAIRDFEEAVADETLVHDGSPLLAEHIGAVDKRTTPQNLVMLVKRKRGGKIDLAIAAVLAHSQVVRGGVTRETRKIEVIG